MGTKKAGRFDFDITVGTQNIGVTACFYIKGRSCSGTLEGAVEIESPDGLDMFSDEFFEDFSCDIFDTGYVIAEMLNGLCQSCCADYEAMSYEDADGNEMPVDFDGSVSFSGDEIDRRLQPARDDWNASQMMNHMMFGKRRNEMGFKRNAMPWMRSVPKANDVEIPWEDYNTPNGTLRGAELGAYFAIVTDIAPSATGVYGGPWFWFLIRKS